MSTVFKSFLHYRIDEQLGNSMAQVFIAFDNKNQWSVVLKLIQDENEEESDTKIQAERNGAEQQKKMSQLDPRVPPVFDYGVAEGYFYVVMEYVEGQDLSQIIRNAALAPDVAAGYASELCQLIENAQQQVPRIIHGDFKPNNVRITPNGKVKVLDFGIAKALSGNSHSTYNKFRSLEYASPERLDKGTMSVESDLWAVGVMLYEMVSQKRPFRLTVKRGSNQDRQELDRQLENLIRNYPATGNLPSLSGSCPDSLKRVIEKALAPRFSDRYQTPTALREDLERFLRREKTLAETELDTFYYDAETTRTNIPLADVPTKPTSTPLLDTPTKPTSTPLPNAPPTRPIPKPEPSLRPVQPVSPASARPAPQSPRVPAATAQPKSRLWLGVLAGVVLLIGYAVWNEFSVYRGLQAVGPEIAGANSPDAIKKARQLYQSLTDRGLGLAARAMKTDLKKQLLAHTEAEIGRYRNADTAMQVKKSDWQEAELCMDWAMQLQPEQEAEARQRYCEGHVLRLSGQASEAVRKFEAAAKLKPDWLDPNIGLARVYSYDKNIKDPQKALEYSKKVAEMQGHQDNRTIALEADNCLLVARRAAKLAHQQANQPEEKSQWLTAQENCQRASNLYSSIISFGNAAKSLDVARGICQQAEQRLNELNANGGNQD